MAASVGVEPATRPLTTGRSAIELGGIQLDNLAFNQGRKRDLNQGQILNRIFLAGGHYQI